jgi:PAS domain S-box-containing protein
VSPRSEKRTSRAKVTEEGVPGSFAENVAQPGRASELRRRYSATRTEFATVSTGASVESILVALLDVAVPLFCDWCVIDLADALGELHTFAIRNSECPHPHGENLLGKCCFAGLAERAPTLSALTKQVLAHGQSTGWSDAEGELPRCLVVAMRVNDLPFATVAFIAHPNHPGYGPDEIETAQDVVWGTGAAIEGLLSRQNAREAVRHTQRIASQLHQLIATSITLAGLRSEQEILMSLASSTRNVFNADTAIVNLESGAAAPLCGVAHRGKKPLCVVPGDGSALDEFPSSHGNSSVPWRENDWLVAPVLERRDLALGVVAIRRESGSEFATEDREVLTLLAQMASTALGAAELSRTIQHSETRWRILVETAPVGIVEVDIEGHVRWWNRGAARIFAWPEFSEPASSDRPNFPEDARQRLSELWLGVRAGSFASGRDLVDIEIRGRRRDLTASAAVLPSADGEARGILTLIDDVTDHRELTSELRHAHQMEIRGQVASSVAHDFNNLLTLISGYAEILSSHASLDDRASQMVKEIQSTASRASSLTEQLQSIGRTKASEPVVLSPDSAIRSIGEVLERIVGVDVALVWSLGEHSSSVRVDADQFEQMILNLALNARDAMPSGGQLSISVEARAIGSDEALTLNVTADDYVLISVTDTGVGMDEETRRRCFEPLFTTKGPFKGTGLGLAAARRLVEESGGSIQCRSQVGRGTTFEIYLPALNERADEQPPIVSASNLHGPATILLAEDDEGLRRLIVQALERNGYLVLEANSGERALELARDFEGPIDLLLSDVVMGLISGHDLALALQASNPELAVILMSGTADAGVLDGLISGTGSFLAKPFRPSALIDEIHALLARPDAPAILPSGVKRG